MFPPPYIKNDEYVSERYETHPLWYATLSNGQVVVQDDGRPGTTDSGWSRLKLKLKREKLNISTLTIGFRSMVLTPLPYDKAGYFFCQSMEAIIPSNISLHSYIIGYIDDYSSLIYCLKYKVPDLLFIGEEKRNPDKPEFGDFLIRNEYNLHAV